MFHSNGRFSACRVRRGLSLLEVIGCIMAVVVGVWLGAQYLGVNLHSVAYTTLDETEIIEKLPEELRPEPPAGMEPLKGEQMKRQLQDELEAIHLDVAKLQQQQAAETAGTPASPATGEHSGQLADRGEETLALWSRLVEIRLEVERIQESAQQLASEQNVWQVLQIRQRAYEYGAKAVKATMAGGGDPQALQFAQQLVDWYERGAQLYGDAMKVWQGQHDVSRPLPQDRMLDKSHQQHDNEALLLFQKGERLREVLIRRYDAEFPSLGDDEAIGRQPTPAESSEPENGLLTPAVEAY